jgi:hypothetical protein
MSGYSRCSFHHLPPYLGLHERPYYLDYSRKDHATFHLHLGLHHLPGHSGHRRRCVRSRRTARRVRLRGTDRQSPAPIAIVVAILCAPRSMRPLSLSLLARARSARPLSVAYTSIRQKPAATHRARSLLPHSDADHRRASHRRPPPSRCRLRYRRPPPSRCCSSDPVGHFCQAGPGLMCSGALCGVVRGLWWRTQEK